jgi:hypothetical protein
MFAVVHCLILYELRFLYATINITGSTESGVNVCYLNDIEINAHLFVNYSSGIGYGG